MLPAKPSISTFGQKSLFCSNIDSPNHLNDQYHYCRPVSHGWQEHFAMQTF